MSPPNLDQLCGVLRAADPDVMEADELVTLTRGIAQLKSWCDALQVRATRRQRALAADGRADDPRHTIAREGRQSSKDARATAEREHVCTSMPTFEDALLDGSISTGHLDAIAHATRNLTDEVAAEFTSCSGDLLDDARRLGVDAFERNCRELAKHLTAATTSGSEADELDRQRVASNVHRWVDSETGMCHTHVELDPVRDRGLWAAIDSSRAALKRGGSHRRVSWEQLSVDALVGAIGGGARTDRVPEINVLIDHRWLLEGAHRAGVCETDNGMPLPVSTGRRLCCDAELLPIVLDGDGRVLDVGLSRRTASWPQRQALRAMYRTCAHPDCTATFDMCRMHHVVPWKRGGPTDIDNLLPLCEVHHHLVHEGGWDLQMLADRTATWVRPDGTLHHAGPTVDRRTSSAIAA